MGGTPDLTGGSVSKKINVLTLFSGRWYSWEPYWNSLISLDYPRENIALTWYSNANGIFKKFLEEKAKEAEKEGFKVSVYLDDGVKVSGNAFINNGMRTLEHALAICSLYNAAWQVVDKSKRVLMIEDDTAIPSHSAKRFNKALDENKKACYVSGVAFDRHSPSMFVWEIEKQPKGWCGNRHETYVSFTPQQTWGVRKTGAAGFGCTMIDHSRIPNIGTPIFRPQVTKKGADHFIGCDIAFCFDVQQKGAECLVDYDVRAFHYDANGKPH